LLHFANPIAAVTAPPTVPLQILAGPGSGKTRVLTSRVAHLVRCHGYKPYTITAVTFTNKAAAEMRKRLIGLLGEQEASQLVLGESAAEGVYIDCCRQPAPTLCWHPHWRLDSHPPIEGLLFKTRFFPGPKQPPVVVDAMRLTFWVVVIYIALLLRRSRATSTAVLVSPARVSVVSS
jgi:hypothetical protein